MTGRTGWTGRLVSFTLLVGAVLAGPITPAAAVRGEFGVSPAAFQSPAPILQADDSTAEPAGADGDRGADNGGRILLLSAALVAVMLAGAVLVARDEAGRHDGEPGDPDAHAGDGTGRHTARSPDEAWPHRR